jgi:hypothetical protein
MVKHTTASLGPYSWSDISDISLSIVFDPGVIEINVFPTCLSDLKDFGGCDWNMGLPLLPGSRLFGHLTWSMRQSVSRPGIASVRRGPVFLNRSPSKQP